MKIFPVKSEICPVPARLCARTNYKTHIYYTTTLSPSAEVELKKCTIQYKFITDAAIF